MVDDSAVDQETLFAEREELLQRRRLLGAADALLGLSRSSQAITMLRRALELEPRNRGAHHRLGLALRAFGDEAETVLQPEFKLEPTTSAFGSLALTSP